MTAYDNDPRVQLDPHYSHNYYEAWVVTGCDYEFNVVRGDDGIYRAFVFDSPPVSSGWRPLGRLLPNIPAGDFDSVVHELIGDPR